MGWRNTRDSHSGWATSMMYPGNPQSPRHHPIRIVLWVVAIALMLLVFINILIFDASMASLLSWLHQYSNPDYSGTGY